MRMGMGTAALECLLLVPYTVKPGQCKRVSGGLFAVITCSRLRHQRGLTDVVTESGDCSAGLAVLTTNHDLILSAGRPWEKIDSALFKMVWHLCCRNAGTQ